MGDEQGVPIRPPAVADLCVDSRDRYSTFFPPFETTSSEIIFQSPQALLSGYFTRVAISDLQMQWRTPNINPYNNQIGWAWSNSSTNTTTYYSSIVSPTDFYDLSGLITTVKNTMNIKQPGKYKSFIEAQDANTSLTYGGIETTDASEFHWFIPVQDGLTERARKFFRTCNTLKSSFDPANISAVQTLITADADLAYTRFIDICSDNLSKFSKVKDSLTRQKNNYTNILTRVYLVPFFAKERFVGTAPFTMSLEYSQPKQLRWNPEEYVYDFDLTIYDEYGETLYWSEFYSTEYQFTLKASET